MPNERDMRGPGSRPGGQPPRQSQPSHRPPQPQPGHRPPQPQPQHRPPQPQPGRPLPPPEVYAAAAYVTYVKPNPEDNAEYNGYLQEAYDIRDYLLGSRTSARETSAQRNISGTSVICPHCGASTVPDYYGRCEYCGSSVQE